MVFSFEARPYGPDSTPAEIQAIRDCIYLYADDIVMYREVPVPSLFSIELFQEKLDRVSAELDSYKLLVDLTRPCPPDPEIRARLKQMFKSQTKLRQVAVFTGDSPDRFMLSIAAQFVFSVLGPPSFSVHTTLEEALQALRRGVAPVGATGVTNEVTQHLVDIGFGFCTITRDAIAASQGNRSSAEILVGLRFLHEELEWQRKQRETAEAEVRRRAEELERLNEQLKELDKLKTEFFSNVSHEFRTPLTLILGPLEELLSLPALAPHGQQLAIIHRNSLRLSKLVNTLLDFSRIEAGRHQASFEPTDLALFTRDLASSFRSATEGAGLDLLVDCPPLPEPVYVDREMWEKVVLNLVSNAFKFTLRGRIRVTLRAEGGHAELEVADTGTGIPQAELPRIFERFHRVPEARGRTYEGTGIGLALVKELVQLNGGTIECRSIVDQGTTFVVRLPLGSAHLPADRIRQAKSLTPAALGEKHFVEEAKRWAPESAEGPVAGTGDGARILVVEDNADMRDYVRRILAGRWQVETVGDGARALVRAKEVLPDLVLSDVMMPGLDGMALLRELRDASETREIPIVILSARAGEEARVQGLNRGADAYLVKPFSERELISVVDGLLRKHRRSVDRLRSKNEELARMNSELEAFAFVSAHDLQEPTRTILTYLQLLQRRCSAVLSEDGREYVALVVRTAKHMRELVDGLLSYATLAAKPSGSLPGVVDCGEVVGEVVDSLRLVVDESRAVITYAGLPRVKGDRTQITQLFQNLIANAIKFRRGVPPEIRVSAERRGTDWILAVADNGIGISKAYHEKVFALFQRLHTQEQYPGTGIGLALCKKIIERHGGKCWLDSEEGKGTTFYFALPAAA